MLEKILWFVEALLFWIGDHFQSLVKVEKRVDSAISLSMPTWKFLEASAKSAA
jgi:hypothetical protein